MPDLQMITSERAGGRLLKLVGPLTLSSMFDFQDAVRQGSGNLYIDLSEVPYMDSAGLGAILGAYASCQRNSRKFGLIAVPDRVNTLLNVAGVDKMVPKFDTVEAAES
jgi:anti-sigma B factor antagonist